ncbi:MAG TPA: nuclear transport factor 2 family protein [Saprospiraceae bacterium]|nr:nuclear transport factor 2 family protein [Saprospiraceae bacterium]HMQ85423.1 nuclear transport factor 2 family protein [Saprospiraceae bacterium]
MKPIFFVYGFGLVLFLASCQPSSSPEADIPTNPPAIDYEGEKEAIMKVIDGESEAFWNKDFEKFASYWAHEPYIRTLGWWQAGGVTVVSGWEERSARTKAHMEESPEPNPTANKVRRENINLRIFQDVAWLTFDQYGEDTGDSLMDMPGLSRETRILEKHNGEWKIVYVGWLLEGAGEE